MERLWQAIEEKGDFPTISSAAREIASAMRDEAAPGFDLASAVLSDFALTQKVIRLANSAMYAGIGGSVATVSRAIFVLGTETVAHLALGQKFLEHLERTATGSTLARQELTRVVIAGAVARSVTAHLSSRVCEEAVVSALVRNLGRLLVAYYLPDKWEQVQARVAEHGCTETVAAEEELGLGLFDIGRQIGEHWGLPTELINTMRPLLPGAEPHQPLGHADWLVAVASFSADCANAISQQAAGGEAMAQLAATYAPLLGQGEQSLKEATVAAQQDEECQRLLEGRKAGPQDAAKPSDAFARLQRGLTDLAEMKHTAGASSIAGTVLETMHAGMGFKRTVLFLRNGNTKKLNARMALGPGTRELLPALQLNEAFEPDVFHLSLAQNQPVIIEDCHAPGMATKLPAWFKSALPTSRGFLCVPLVAGSVPVGLLYGDWDSNAGGPRVESHELAQLTQMARVLLEALVRRS
jgi:HD-like signal output (HDOD) protein